jgi:GMP synthase (glutamine-hydrolysing)
MAANGIGELAKAHQTVLILDYGSQYTQLIARRIREFEMFSILMPGDASMVS